MYSVLKIYIHFFNPFSVPYKSCHTSNSDQLKDGAEFEVIGDPEQLKKEQEEEAKEKEKKEEEQGTSSSSAAGTALPSPPTCKYLSVD